MEDRVVDKSISISFITRFRRRYKNEIKVYSLLSYPLLHWFVFFILALSAAFYLSLTSWDIFRKPEFIGIKNYVEILSKDDVFRKALVNTIIWTLGVSTVPVALGLLLALFLNNISKLDAFFRALLYWPALVSAVAITSLQKKIFESTPYSLANKVVSLFGIEPIRWLDNPDIALYSLMLWPILLGFSQPMLFFVAGLKQIPQTYYEAATVDGAKAGTIFFKITMPLLKPIIFLNVIVGMINGFRIIAPMQLITFGGPANATISLALEIYNNGFTYTKMGYASALAFILLAIILIVTAIQNKIKGDRTTFE